MCVSLPATTAAYFLDEDDTFQILGRAYTQSAMRTEATSGFTFPDTPAGHIVQQRNLLEVEVAHRLDGWLENRPVWLNDVWYRLLYKGVYEGVCDYGPREYSEQVEVNPPSPFDPRRTGGRDGPSTGPHTTGKFSGTRTRSGTPIRQTSTGPLFLRIGRQNLSWGETDGFRLLDMIDPLDNRFGLPLVEDLDDRRIPLWMTRGTLALPWRTTNLTNLTIDSYFVAGADRLTRNRRSRRAGPVRRAGAADLPRAGGDAAGTSTGRFVAAAAGCSPHFSATPRFRSLTT